MVHQVKQGEVVGHDVCASCREEVEVKVNSKGGLYAYCTAVVRPEAKGNKKYCWDRHTFSPYAVGEILNDYLEGKALENVHIEPREEQGSADDTGRTEGIDERGDDAETIVSPTVIIGEPPRGGLAAGLKHFLTADE
ncbi:MAG: hypothetical protein COB36_11015 [Alphaproteobacteria bacterium]|nr:MAG: hypothetical protein COB36_11015 [Alphaproteobacteria bacterium]